MCLVMDNLAPSPVRTAVAMPADPVGDILAVVTGAARSSLSAVVAASLAARWNSTLTGCLVPSARPHADAPTAALDTLPWMPERASSGDDAAACAAFDHFGRRHGVCRTRWVGARASAVHTLQALAAWHDLAVLGREVAEPDGLLESLFEALLACHVPCLVLPEACESAPRFARIAVGWNGSLEAVRALHAALPLLRAAHEVHLLDGAAGAALAHDQGERFEPRDYLASHGMAVVAHPVDAAPHEAGAALLTRCAQVRAELLVMGAYSRVAWRERAFGGATRYILRHAPIPALMHH